MTSEANGTGDGEPLPHAGLLAGKVALITGASAGIGVGIATAMIEMGAAVIGMARRGHDSVGTATDWPTGYPIVPGDVRNDADCARVVDNIVSGRGRLDILVNNAGSMGARPIAPLTATTVEDWDEMMAVNVRGPFLLARAALPHMIAQGGGVIVSISSFTAAVAVADMSGYNTSKAAVLQLSDSIAVEFGDRGVRSIGVLMGGVDTKMTDAVGLGLYKLAHGADAEPPASEASPMLMPAIDVGRAIGLLCSDAARLITGTTVAIDGAVSAGSLSSMLVHMAGSGLLAGGG